MEPFEEPSEDAKKLMQESMSMKFTMGEWAFIHALLSTYAESSGDIQPVMLIAAINQNVMEAAARGDIGTSLG